MTVSFQLHNAEELNILTAVLIQLKQAGIPVQVIQTERTVPILKKTPFEVSHLYGIIRLPTNFDYKAFMADTVATELLKKHG